MRPLISLVQEGQRASLRLARQSQAVVIQAVAWVAGQDGIERPRLAGRAWRFQLGLAARIAGDPAHYLDSMYDHAQRLVSLNQEFAHRILEVLEVDEPLEHEPEARSNVFPLLARPGS